ncbi:hypothetical protein [Brevibacillus fulvus]|uniref:Holliday junction resolvase-like predicted endonuclease n=1 Tax=Brevibacillus fulvus TaxID=1125967 RepID=A0A938Y0L1_9BACL|nr:hypothetical protein [Brevibacillus fulvus]MBM7591714.1 Holliday junction resolvase-like predicted endonuclease [Brevibacillus fulvus]
METDKSSNHAKITGDFAEHLIMYWLSKYGFECVHVTHTGIDLIATRKSTGQRLGISVKSRSRETGQTDYALTIRNPADEHKKVDAACAYFACEPYFAIVIDQANSIRAYLTSKENIISKFGVSHASTQNWNYKKLEADDQTVMFSLDYGKQRWFQ